MAHTYCRMEEIPGCGGGGWTLVLKIDGNKVLKRVLSAEQKDDFARTVSYFKNQVEVN